MADHDHLLKLQKKLADEGMLIEAGWVGFRLSAIPQGAPKDQLSAMKIAFMAGAAHVFTAMIGIMDEDAEPTDADMERMQLIHEEMERFNQWYALRYGDVKGSG